MVCLGQTILVTGGAGFIGSHTVVQLLKQGFDVSIIDNFNNSSMEAVNRVRDLVGPQLSQNLEINQGDLRDKEDLERVFSKKKFDAVIHFAGLKAVGESVAQPRKYFDNNIVGHINLFEVMAKYNCKKMVFSSSATVYGQPTEIPCVEDSKLQAMNPYGRTKLFSEEMARDIQKAEPEWRIILLRYFNPVGAHESGRIGEDPRGIPNNLMPYIQQVAVGRLPVLNVYGYDYPTKDGSAIRDYIHVMDLADGHIAALRKLFATDVLDTGSQLSWIQCNKKAPAKLPSASSFNPSLSSTFSVLPCNHPLCKPRVPDFTLPTSCDQNRLCHYSYFYADGTYAEGNLVREKFTFKPSAVSTPPLILGCATETSDSKGILGMNLGRLSFASQAKLTKFSYCVPTRMNRPGYLPTGSFILGNNPSSAGFKYVPLLTFHESQRMPNLDPLAFTLPMQGIRIGAKRLNILPAVFHPNAGGSGQTMIDSGSEFTYLVDEAYNKVREEVVRLAGPKLKKDYVYGGVSDMCFDGNAMEIGRLIGDMAFEFGKGVEIVIPKEQILADVGRGVKCVGIGRSDRLGAASNIIGNFHQQNLWVEFDLANRRVGFGKADCTRSAQ